MSIARLFHADAIIVGDGAPIVDGVVVVDDEVRVIDVGRAEDLISKHVGAAATRVRGVIAPFLVNAHTHLELSCLRGRIAGGHGFVPWVDKLVTTRTEVTDEEMDEGISRAARDLNLSATSAVGEVTNSTRASEALIHAGISGVIFHEMFGVVEAPALKAARELLDRPDYENESHPRARLVNAPSPHTLYTTHPTAVRMLTDAARDNKRRVTIHLAEHPAERAAIELGTGPSVDWMKTRLKISNDALFFPRIPLFDYAGKMGVLSDNTLLVHLSIATHDELSRVRDSGAHAVLCPRSNLFIEMRLPPLVAMMELGMEPALGTDSLASNASLDVLDEARALADRFSSVPAAKLLRMATWNGARALDFPKLGRIARGAAPGLFAVNAEERDAALVHADPSAFLVRNVKSPRTILAKPNPS